jgi:hypothetical protein
MFSTTQSMQQGKSQKFAGNGRTLDFRGGSRTGIKRFDVVRKTGKKNF